MLHFIRSIKSNNQKSVEGSFSPLKRHHTFSRIMRLSLSLPFNRSAVLWSWWNPYIIWGLNFPVCVYWIIHCISGINLFCNSCNNSASQSIINSSSSRRPSCAPISKLMLLLCSCACSRGLKFNKFINSVCSVVGRGGNCESSWGFRFVVGPGFNTCIHELLLCIQPRVELPQ